MKPRKTEMAARPSLSEAMKTADLIHSHADMLPVIRGMGARIGADLKDDNVLFISVMHGGLIFAGHLAPTIPIDMEFDYLHATRYRGATSGGELHWLKQPATSLRDRTVLLVDDILDEGKTLVAIKDYCLAHGARKVLIAVLALKKHDRCVPGLSADYIGVEVPDRYVFGFGMDFHEQGRNLPGIYAI